MSCETDSNKPVILSDAVEDLYHGRLFYEKINNDIGEYFFDALFSDIDSLLLYAEIHPEIFGFYRMLAKRFPFAVYYKFENKTVTVYRVLDLRQNPGKLQTQLTEIDEQ